MCRSSEPDPVRFLHFFRFGYKILLFIEFFYWIGLIPLCFRLLGSPWKCMFSQIFYFFSYFGLQKSLSIPLFSNICIHRFFFFFDLENGFCCWFITNSKTFIPMEKYMGLVEGRHVFSPLFFSLFNYRFKLYKTTGLNVTLIFLSSFSILF